MHLNAHIATSPVALTLYHSIHYKPNMSHTTTYTVNTIVSHIHVTISIIIIYNPTHIITLYLY